MPKSGRRKSKYVPPVPPVPTGREPRALPQPQPDGRRHLAWRFGVADMEGDWGWQNLDMDTMQQIIAKLRDFESMTVHEVFHQGEYPGKWYPVAQLSAPARTRLQQLGRDDFDVVYRLRVGGAERIYGLMIEDIFHLLWWDPDHSVYPTQLRHT